MTNKEKILNYLEENGKATIRDFINLWINSPQEYIRQLREEGYKIDTRRLGNDKHSTYIYTPKELSLF